MVVEKNKVVTFIYALTLQNDEGERIQQVEMSKPMKIVVGRGALLEPFENKLLGLKKGDRFEFTLLSSETFGPYKEKAVTTFYKSVFTEDGEMEASELVVGNFLPMETEEGLPFNGKIVNIDENSVTLDFNHPLAGRDLLFDGEIQDVRDATPDEITSGRVDKARKK